MLKIANWNLERVSPQQERAQRIYKEMLEVSADIWVLTETHKEITLESFYSISCEEIDSELKSKECWSSILSRYPVESLNNYVSDKKRCVACKLEHPKFGLIIVYALVLPWIGSAWNGLSSREGIAFESALAMYQADWEKLQKVYPDALHIVAGDFNQSMASWHYYGSMRNRSKLEVALNETNLHAITSEGNDPIARDSAPEACIDHICISNKAVECITSTKRWPNTDKPDKRLSDHFGVFITLESSNNCFGYVN